MTTFSVSETPIDEALNSVRRKFEMTPKVAIAGFGKAGKSSLFNAIYGQQVAAVSMRTDETQATQTERRFGINFTDTPGIGTGKFSLEKVDQMAVFDRQHVVIHVLNGSSAISAEDEKLHALIERSTARRVTAINKVDILDEREQREYAESLMEKLGLSVRGRDFFFVSAKKREGIDTLVRHIADILPDAMQDAFIGQQRADISLKEKRIRTLVYSKAAIAGAVALIPIPVADIVILTPMQVAMVTAIGYFHGVAVTKERVLELLSVLGAAYGLREAARQLVKLIPGVGSAVSASVAFAGTVALGEAANLWFKRQMQIPADELRQVFTATVAKAREDYETSKTTDSETKAKVEGLTARRAKGELSDDDFARLLEEVVGKAD